MCVSVTHWCAYDVFFCISDVCVYVRVWVCALAKSVCITVVGGFRDNEVVSLNGIRFL